MKHIIASTIIIVALGIQLLSGQQIGDPAPDFEATLLGGETYKLSEHRGKVVMIFFFGNTCPNCKAAGPNIEASIYQVFKENPYFEAVGLDTWNSSSNENSVTGFREATGITFPLAVKAGDVATAYESTYDRLVVVDSEGILVHKGIVAAANDISNTKEAINESLAVTDLQSNPAPDGISLYPNPATDAITLDTGSEMVLNFELYDLTGKQVLELTFAQVLHSQLMNISLKGIGPGIYLYHVQAEHSTFSGKLIIQY